MFDTLTYYMSLVREYNYIPGPVNEPPSLYAIKPDFKNVVFEEVSQQLVSHISTAADCSQISVENVSINGFDAFIIDGVLSSDECSTLCHKIDDCGQLSFWSTLGRGNDEARNFRNADTIEFDNRKLSNILWDRIKEHINLRSITITDDQNNPSYERDLVGRWKPCAVNHNFLVARYSSGGHFSPHTDGRAINDFNHRSFYSGIIYLNDIPRGCGGDTRFFRPEALDSLSKKDMGSSFCGWTADASFILANIQPVVGRMLLFDQALVHEGGPPDEPYTKYIIRTDIIFERTPPLFCSAVEQQAYQMFRSAELLGERGDHDASIKLFKRAFKLSPPLAHFMGH